MYESEYNIAAVQELIDEETLDTTGTVTGGWRPVSEFKYHALAFKQYSASGAAEVDWYVDVWLGLESEGPPTAATSDYTRIPIVSGSTTENTWLLYQPDYNGKSVLYKGAVTWIRGYAEGGSSNSDDTLIYMRLLSH